jgi:hypothetical protein
MSTFPLQVEVGADPAHSQGRAWKGLGRSGQELAACGWTPPTGGKLMISAPKIGRWMISCEKLAQLCRLLFKSRFCISFRKGLITNPFDQVETGGLAFLPCFCGSCSW